MFRSNLATMHRHTADRWANCTAVRHKSFGQYHDVRWSTVRRRADHAGSGFLTFGLNRGDKVALLSENRFEWILCDLALLSTGCVSVPLHAPLTAAQIEYQLAHAQVRGIVVSNKAQAEKLLAAPALRSQLEFVISFDPLPMELPWPVFHWNTLEQRGRQNDPEGNQLRVCEEKTTRADLATILYTSGTTGPPKGVMLSHGNLVSNVEGLLACGDAQQDDILLSWLPYSHIYARTVDLYLTAISASVLCLAECPETVINDLALTQPTWLTAVPRFYEKVWMSVQSLPASERAQRLRQIFGPRIRRLTSGGAPLPPHIASGFIESGIPLLEGYGLTESSPVISFNRMSSHRVGTVGQCLPGVEVKTAEDGEILTRGPHVMQGYWRDEQATLRTVVDNWLLTGDLGGVDGDGFLSITGRKKDLIVTSCGKNIAPSEIEKLLCADPLIDQAIVHGDARPYLTALIVPDFALLSKLASSSSWSLDEEDGFLCDPALVEQVTQRIETALQSVSPQERVRKFLILARPFRQEDEEVTATQKVRRRFILNKYLERFEELYRDKENGHR